MSPSARQRLKETLIQAEGIVLHVYSDSKGYLTLGVGRLVDKRLGGGISQQEAMYLLGNDIDRVISELRAAFSWFDGLNQVRQAALAELCFSMGLGNESHGLRSFVNTLAAFRTGDYERAAHGLRHSKWARDVGPDRAERVAYQVETGRWPAPRETRNA